MRSRFLSPLILSAAIVLSACIPSAQAAVQDRITKAVSANGSVGPLSGNVSGRTKHATDLGAASANQKLQSMSLRFSLTAAQQADLSQLLANQLNPGSPSYHQWLTPEQYGARFGLSSGDLSKVSAWLTSQGLTVTGTARSSTFITFSGTVAQVQHAFGTTIHNVSERGEQHFANLTDPVLPSAIAGVVTSITGLNDFRLKPHSRSHTANIDPSRPLYTQTIGGVTSNYVAPSDLYTIYDYPFNFSTRPIASTNDGTGITIAVMGQTDLSGSAPTYIPDTNITTFRAAAGLPAINLTTSLAGADPGLSPGDIDEAHLDIEWSGASAPGANILYVYGVDVFDNSLTTAIDSKVAPIITISYGSCEADFSTTKDLQTAPALAAYNSLLAQANAEGITVMSSAGDSGATDCDTDGIASEGLNVDFPSSSPFVTAAGGTMFTGDVNTPANYWNNTNTAAGGSAIQYIPEQPWNETTTAAGLSAGGAGGGGASAFFSKPSWQTGAGVPSDSSRDVPDVSLNAASNHDGYMVCTTGGGTAEIPDPPCVNNTFLTSTGTPNVFGGTSFVAPSLAGILALVEQKLSVGSTAATGLGNINPILYGLANGPTAASIFHDITMGNNSVPCSQGTPNCPDGGSIGYNAGVGYDQASGLGTLDVNQLVTNWASAVPAGSGGSNNGGCSPTAPTTGTASCITTTTVTTTSALCGISGTLPLTVTVAGSISGTTPTGTVQFFVDATPLGTAQPLVGGTVTYNLSTASVSSGGHNFSAVYSGDANYAGSKGTVLNPTDGTLASVDIVSTTAPDFSVTPCVGAPITVAPGATAPGVAFTVTPVNGFTGAVNFTVTNNNEMTATTSFTVMPVNITSTAGVATSFVVVASQVTTTAKLAPQRAVPHPSSRTPWYAAGSGATLACMLLLTVPRRRRWGALLVAVLSVAALTAIGCGSNTSTTGGGGGGGGGGGTTVVDATPGVYTFTITGVSGSLVHSTQVTVTVP
jgi:subtilase family serine protease